MRLALTLACLLVTDGASAQDLDQQDLKKALAGYVLTEQHITTLADFATEAAQVADRTSLSPPSLLTSGTLTVDLMAALIDAHPPVKALLSKHHLTARDLILIPIAYMQAALLVKAPPEMLPALAEASGANLANVPLIRDKGEALDALITRATTGLGRVFKQQ